MHSKMLLDHSIKNIVRRTGMNFAMASCVGAATVMSFKAGDVTPALIGITGTILSRGMYIVKKKQNYQLLSITSNGIMGGAIVLNNFGSPLVVGLTSVGIISAVTWCAFDPIIRSNVAKYEIPVSLGLMGSVCGLAFHHPLYMIPAVIGFTYITTIEVERHRELIDTSVNTSVDNPAEVKDSMSIESSEKNVSLSILDNMYMMFLCISLSI